MKMKTNIFFALIGLFISLLVGLTSCQEDDFSADYDIKWPISTIERVEPLSQEGGKTITVYGQNLQFVYNFYIGSIVCEIVETSDGQLTVKVPLAIEEKSPISLTNLYNRKFEYSESFTPILRGEIEP